MLDKNFHQNNTVRSANNQVWSQTCVILLPLCNMLLREYNNAVVVTVPSV